MAICSSTLDLDLDSNMHPPKTHSIGSRKSLAADQSTCRDSGHLACMIDMPVSTLTSLVPLLPCCPKQLLPTIMQVQQPVTALLQILFAPS